MLKVKKFSRVKNKKLYKFLRNINIYIDCNESIDEKCDTIIFYKYYISFYYLQDFCYDFIKNKTFLSNDNSFDYTIQKEIHTNTWMFVCNKLLVLYISNDDIEEFCLSYMFSSVYRFIIRENDFGYVAISISHTTDDIDDVLKFYIMNLSNPKYILMSYFLKNNIQNQENQENQEENHSLELTYNENDENDEMVSFIILNQNVQTLLHDRCHKRDLYKHYDVIGYGEMNRDLNIFVEFIFNYAIVFKNYPVNYLPF